MADEAHQRLDKWLFFARVVKSRSLAAKLVQAGRVRINGNKTDQPAASVKPGDVLTITVERRILVYRVLEAGVRRGPAEEARLLYDDMSPQVAGAGDTPPDALGRLRGTRRPRTR